ncbi:MAG: DMT family transporter [Chloroflexi bacterium]|nr:DMT family transporter [Chloroflexota bacterium]
MIAIVGGLGAAISWAIATLSSSRSSRMIGPMSVLAWVMIVGFVVSIPPTIASLPTLAPMSIPQIAGLVVNGVSYTGGLLLAYQALVIGRVSIVAPIVSTEGGLSALASVVLGEVLGVPTALVLGAIAIGVVLASIDRRADEVAATGAPAVALDVDDPSAVVPAPTAPEPAAVPRHGREDAAATRRSVLLAIAAAAAFSIGLITSARLGDVPISWILLTSRAVGVVLIALPLVVRGRLRISRRALPLVVISGVLEAVGSALYVTGAHASPATAAVLSSQFAAIAALSAFVLFGERLARVQLAGITVIAIGITVLAIVRA